MNKLWTLLHIST